MCAALAVAPTVPTVTDNCGNTLTPTGPVTGGTYVDCEGTITYTYTYMDCEGNTNDSVYTYTIDYSGSLTAPSNGSSTVSCVESCWSSLRAADYGIFLVTAQDRLLQNQPNPFGTSTQIEFELGEVCDAVLSVYGAPVGTDNCSGASTAQTAGREICLLLYLAQRERLQNTYSRITHQRCSHKGLPAGSRIAGGQYLFHRQRKSIKF